MTANNPNIADYGFGGKYRTRKQDDEYRSRQKTRKWSKEVCIHQLEELMDMLKAKIKDNELKDLQIIIDKMMDIIKYLYPPVQTNVNMNVDITADAVVERLKNWKKKQIIVEKEV